LYIIARDRFKIVLKSVLKTVLGKTERTTLDLIIGPLASIMSDKGFSMSRLKFYLLGPPRLECDGATLEFNMRKNVALIAYLAVTGHSHTREALVALLWPELEPSRARAGLRRNLSVLRKMLDGEWLAVERETIGLDPTADAWLDVDRFHRLLQAWQEHGHPQDELCPDCLTALAEAVELCQGDFMAGFTLRDSAAFDEWQFFQTEGLRQELASALERLVCGHTAHGDYDAAISYARRWLALDPLHEPVHRQLMQLYAWSGQRAAALRQYAECERVLHEELGLDPGEETSRLYEAIREKRHPAPPGGHVAAPGASQTSALHGRYLLDTEIGRSGMAVLYSARDTLLERDVAVKLVSATALDSAGRARLVREARAIARLNHPNIVTVYDVGEADGAPFIVMELIQGESLHDLMLAGDCRPDALDKIVSIAQQICTALEHAHAHDIVHRNLKPENVLLTADGRTKLVDFGLARPMASRLTSEGDIVGTVFYLAPELALGQKFDGRADLYALGVMLYELTTGRLPFTADKSLAVISQHLYAPVVPPCAKNANIPPALNTLIVRLLSKDPADRPASAAEVRRALEQPAILDTDASPVKELSVLERIERGRLVGRQRELQEARALWNQALAGQGGLLLISGEPGIGKTRLVRELLTQAEVSGGRALVGASYAQGGTPFGAWGQIIRQVLGDGTDAGLELPELVLADLLTLVPELCLRYPHVPANPPLDDPQAEQHRLFQNVLTFVALLSRAPLLLALEDVHWADSGTLALLRHMARHTRHQRVLIVATYREVELDQARPLHKVLLDLNREGLATRLKLPRLDRAQTEELLAALLDDEVTPEFLDSIYRETEGNPFFAEEICKALIESGELWYEDGHWGRLSIKELRIPQSVRVAIQSRVQVLPVEAQETLCLAAILGREFEFDTLAKASQLGEEALIDALDSAERAQLIEELNGARSGTFAFVHTLFPITLVEGLRTLQRRRLHRQAASAIEALCPDDGSYLEALAHHYCQAGESEKAVGYLLKAGDRARKLYASEEAIDHYRQALILLDEPALRQSQKDWQLQALRGLGQVYVGTDKIAEAEACFQEAVALGQEMGLASDELVRLYNWLGEPLYWQGRYDDMIHIGEKGLALLGDDVESVGAALMNQLLAAGHLEKGNLEPYREFTYRTAGFIQRLPYSRGLRPAYISIIGICVKNDKSVEEAFKWIQALKERGTQHRDVRALAEMHFMKGITLGLVGDLHGAIPQLQEGLELCLRIGDVPHASRCLLRLGEVFLALGNLQKAKEYADRALEASTAIEIKQDIALSYRLIGLVHLFQGDWEKAIHVFHKAIDIFQETNQYWFETWVTFPLGQAHLARNERGEALRRFQEVLALVGAEELRGYASQLHQTEFNVNPLVANVLSELGKAHEDPKAFRDFCDRCRTQAGDGAFVQWYLEPAEPRAMRSSLREEFIETLPPAWTWQDPFADCSYTLRNGLEIQATDGRGLGFANVSAPRMLRSVAPVLSAAEGGDWAAQTACVPAAGDKPAIGGLVLWKDKKNYLRLDRGATGEGEILFMGCLGNQDILVGRGHLRSERVFLRLERVGEWVHAFCSADGENWFTVGRVEFPVEEPLQVGLHAIGHIDRGVYHGDYLDGTAIRFESFQLWET
jgi:DNA-binding SARP family transcriptional activator